VAKYKQKKCANRINCLVISFFLIGLFVLVKLFYIQVLSHEKYEVLAQEQHWLVEELPAERGSILSCDGETLAANQDHYLLYAESKNIDNKIETAEILAKLLSSNDFGSYEELFAKYLIHLEKDLWWVGLERGIDPQTKKEVEGLELSGIGFDLAPKRYYPEGSLASHVLGFVAFDSDGNKRGYFGIEGNFDGDLYGKPGKLIQEKDADGNPILVGGYNLVDSIAGRDIVLTIDRSVQYIVERELKLAVERYGAASGTVIVMDPITSEIIAMANYPNFDPSNLTDESEVKNLAIADTYEPGSVLKAFTISAGIDTGKITTLSTFIDSGPVTYSGYTIDNWDGEHHGVQNIAQLLQKSNNIGAAWVGHQIGADDLHNYFGKFGFGEKTDVSLEGEDTGTLRDSSTWSGIDLANISFGQGISATPLQILNGFNAIANGGILNRPRVVSNLITENGSIEMTTKKIRRVISEKTSEIMIDLLVSAVDQGESRFCNIEGYKIAGKTGTAEIFTGEKYDTNETNATFAGFLPETKKFSMIVRLERPSTSSYASETAVPLWMDLAHDLVTYYAIPPDRE